MEISTLAIALITYGLLLYYWNKKITWRLNEKISRRTIQFNYLLTLLLIISEVLSRIDNLSFSGQWTTRIIVIGFLLSGFLIYPLSNWTRNNKIEKLYFRFFSFLPSFTGFLLLIPFTGALLFYTLVGRILNPVNRIYFDSDRLRVQSSYVGPMWPAGILVYQKMGMLEKQLVKSPISDLFIDSIRVEQQQHKAVIIFIDKTNERQDSLELELE